MSSIQAIVDRQIQRWNVESKLRKQSGPSAQMLRPVITVSRTLGSGGEEVARTVAERMNLQIFGRELIDQIAERGEVRRELVEALDEHARSRVESWVDGMLRRRIFDEGDYYHQLVQVVLPLAQMGSVVIVGRGANFILHGQCRSLDVRIVAPLESRINRLMAQRAIGRSEAEQEIRSGDADRGKLMRRLFDRDWGDPLAYHLVLNTGEVCAEAAATIIETAWLQLALKCEPKTAG